MVLKNPWDNNKETAIEDIPTKVLIWLVFRGVQAKAWRDVNGGQEGVKAVCAEVRKRGLRGRTLAAANRLDPPPCKCGRVGTRIIGSQTFCRKCVPKNGTLGTSGGRWARAWHEQASEEISSVLDDIDRKRKADEKLQRAWRGR